MVVPITDGVPGTGVEVTLPSGAQDADLNQISCPVTGPCVAAGYYEPAGNVSQALVVPVSDGVPSTGIKVTLPANVYTTTPNGVLSSVACQTSGSCTAVGSYFIASNDVAPLSVQISNGVPATGVEDSPPEDYSGSPVGQDDNIGCPLSGTCETLGIYEDASGVIEPMVQPLTAGSPGTAREFSLPDVSGLGGAGALNAAMSCSSSALCLISGDYSSSSGQYLSLLVTVNASGASVPTVTPPSGTDLSVSYPFGFDGVGCIASGPCLSDGYYAVGSSTTDQGLQVQTSASGTVGSAVATPMPSDESTVGPDGPDTYFEGVACGAVGSCVADGNNYATTGVYELYALSEQAPLVLNSSTVPAAAVGSAYQAQLAASGAWGVYGWSVASGSLPAGVTLNSQTGAISGTPTVAGSSTFVVKATGTGSPAQTATEQLTIAGAGPAPPSTTSTKTTSTTTTTTTPPPTTASVTPQLKLLSAGGAVSAGRLAVKLACSTAACSGSIKVERTELVTVKKGKKRVREHRTVVLGGGGYTTSAGTTKALEVTLNATGRRALASAKNHRLAVTLVGTVAGGAQTTLHETIHTAVKRKKK